MATMNPDVIQRKIRIADLLLGILEKDPDPRAPEVARILEEQKAELEGMLGEHSNPLPPPEETVVDKGKPAPVVVGLNTLRMTVKRG